MKKIIVALLMLTCGMVAHAQFEQGKKYFEGALNSVGASFNEVNKFNFGLEVKFGYFVGQNWMLNAHAAYTHNNPNINCCTLGVGTRYYLIENGLYGEFNVKGLFEKDHNDIMPGVEAGYAFFINDKITIEPAIYYNHSFSNRDYSTVGLKIGLGIYF